MNDYDENEKILKSLTDNKEKLKILLNDVMFYNDIPSLEKDINVFIGDYALDNKGQGKISNLEPLFTSKILFNPYLRNGSSRNKTISLYTKKEYATAQEVIVMVGAGRFKYNTEIFNSIDVKSFDELGLERQSTIIDIAKRVQEVMCSDNPSLCRLISNCIEAKENELKIADLKNEIKAFIDAKSNSEKYREECLNFEEKIKNLKEEKTNIEKQRKILEDNLASLNDEIKSAKQLYRRFYPDYEDDKNKKIILYDKKTDILQLLKKRLEYDYSDDILLPALMALNTSQIITLFGDPGTGKTTFVIKLAKALGAKLTIVSVQNNWTDNTDLMGFYNPINKTFQSTTFTDALIDAKIEWEKSQEDGKDSRLHFICLDEMNLSRVEYYFASFLSMLQLEDSLRIIKLLPNDLNDKITKYINKQKDMDDKMKSLIKYRDFIFPPNVRFLGTINNDDTTNVLSPKVVDRSFYIEMVQNNVHHLNKNICDDNCFFSADLFRLPPEEIDDDDFVRQNYRFKNYVKQMWPAYKCWVKSPDKNSFYEYVIISKILPSLKNSNDFSYDKNTYPKANIAFENHKYKNDMQNDYDYIGG